MPRKPKEIDLGDFEPAGLPKGYCVKCKKKKQPFKNPVLLIPVKGNARVAGTHAKCGTKMTIFVGPEFVEDVKAAA